MIDITGFLFGKAGIILLALMSFFILERVFPVARWVGGFVRLAKNLELAAINVAIGPLIVIPVTQFASSHAWHWRPELWTGWLGLLIDLLILDLWIYWWHRANHRLPFLWRFHEVHHLDETLDTTSALRFHFGEVILSALVRAVFIVILDIPLASVVAFEVLIAIVTIFHHSNLRLPAYIEKHLSLVVVTPSIHWVHHHAIWRDTDSNYSTVLSVWDRLFGSRSWTVRTPAMPIGVEGQHDKPVVPLIFDPLQRR